MSFNRDWMYNRIGEKRKNLEEFVEGVEGFLDFAFVHAEREGRNVIRCPCAKCAFGTFKSRDDVRMCLLKHGFTPRYTKWTRHGECSRVVQTNVDEAHGRDNWPMEMLMDTAGQNFECPENPNNESQKFYSLFNDADEELWEGCENHTKLSAVTLLLHLKTEYGVSNSGFSAFLLAFKDMLPKNNKLPDSYYRCKVMMKDLGFPHDKIHACVKDCVLYRGEYLEMDACPICKEPRYKSHDKWKGKRNKPIPRKVLRYFPLIPRLQRLYLSCKTAKPMRWHKESRANIPGELRHPADGEAWKEFDLKHPSFAEDARSVRLALATDGFNPFGHSSTVHSTWPVFLVPYNLPPWLCMKEEYMFMTMLIPGPKSPGREIDVYLQPLIDELILLWNVGVLSYDNYSKQNFMLKAAVLWTISDFPARGMLEGWSTHGKLGCPCCMSKDVAFNLKNGRKPCYFGCHRRWLPTNHRWRKDENNFNKKKEDKCAPPLWTGVEVLQFVRQFNSMTLGKGTNTSDKAPEFGVEHNWTKKSIFFELPYWSTLSIRHMLDVMHIVKNIFDNVFNTVMNVKGKSKDHLKARMDLKDLHIRPQLHPQEGRNGRLTLPKASYCLTNEQVKQVCVWLKSLKLPDGYAANISRCVNLQECKISGLKSHDCHVLLERFLPIAFRDILPKEVWEPLNSLSHFFRVICSKVTKVEDLCRADTLIIETLCKLEMIFPPSFFDVMEHLPIHLAYEAKLGGPVHFRWMYPFERYLCVSINETFLVAKQLFDIHVPL